LSLRVAMIPIRGVREGGTGEATFAVWPSGLVPTRTSVLGDRGPAVPSPASGVEAEPRQPVEELPRALPGLARPVSAPSASTLRLGAIVEGARLSGRESLELFRDVTASRCGTRIRLAAGHR